MSLLEKALQNTPPTTTRQEITPEHVELAQAFIKSEVGITQVNVALGKTRKSVEGYITIARALRHQYQQNK